MRLTARQLNRTLLHRQHLLARRDATVAEEIGHLLGLQAQESLPPYLSLAARLTDLDPGHVTRGLEDRSLVRALSHRGTVHLLTAEDAVVLRPWTQPRMEAQLRTSQTVGAARGVDREAFDAALDRVLQPGPLPLPELSARLAEAFAGPTPAELGNLARVAAPLVQLPPRGCWRASGGVVYDRLDRWTGLPLAEPDVPEIVRRYLAAYGPATAADLTTWSGVTRLGPVVGAVPDLVRHEDDQGRTLFDLPDGQVVDPDTPAPVRLLGRYDEVWLAHAGRDRVTTAAARAAWSGSNGASGSAVLVDGMLSGLWRVVDARVDVTQVLRRLTRAERDQLDEEVARVDDLLAR